MSHRFQVDLRGIVDLLSRHLYSSPRVYVRELLQNAVDALAARAALGHAWTPAVHFEPGPGGELLVHDNGIGLTEAQVHDLLATIGRSSKRDDLGFSRHEFIGQFGIGLLACFLVGDEVTVDTRSATDPDAGTIRWTGHAEGHYTVEPAPRPRAEPGTTVILRARPDAGPWLSPSTVERLVREYGSLLPYPVSVAGVRVTETDLPWRAAHPDPAARRAALDAYADRALGVRPFDVIDLAVPEAGLTGVGFVLPDALNPSARSAHRVYLKRMLLGERVEKLLPDWAFFVRCVVDSTELRPTANREQLYDDDLLATVQRGLGAQVRDWLVNLAAAQPDRMRAFLEVHHLGVRALALHDTEMLRLVDRWLEFETSEGPMTLAAYRRRHGTVCFTPTVEEFRQLAGVAAAQGVGLVNAGYAYEAEIIRRLPLLDPAIQVERLDPAALAMRFDTLAPEVEAGLAAFLSTARWALAPLGCEPVVRSYEPAGLPALYVSSPAAELRTTAEAAEGVWAELTAAMRDPDGPQRPQLVLNHTNPLVRRVSTLPDPVLVTLALEALYSQALVHSHHPMRPIDVATQNRSFLSLLEWALHDRTGD